MLAWVGQTARVVADDTDDVLLVLEAKLLLDRLPVPGGHGNIIDPHRIRDPAVGEERQGLPCPGAVDPADAVVVPHPDAGHVGERLLALGPAVAGNDHPGVLVNDVIFLTELQGRRGDLDTGPPRLTE